MSNQLYLVMEDDNVPYEGRSWPIAGFTTEYDALFYLTQKQQQYHESWQYLTGQQELFDEEYEAAPEDEEELVMLLRLEAKYPQRWGYGDKHRFYVAKNTIPLNPML